MESAGERSARLVDERRVLERRLAEINDELGDRRTDLAAASALEERFRRMLDGGWDILTLIDVEPRTFYVSGSVERVLGYSVDEYLKLLPFELTHPAEAGKALHEFATLTSQPGCVATFETRLRHKAGHYVWMETTAVNLLHEAALRGVVTASRDITVRKRAEEQLQQLNTELERRVADRTAELSLANLALARASRTKDEFLAAMSHELRTPLNAVLGLSEALQEGIYGSVRPEQHTALKRIEESGRHLLSLIGDILDLSKIEAGKMALASHSVAIDDVCRASLRMIQETAYKKRLGVSFKLEEGCTTILADELRLKQILVNLLSNAAKFTPEGGRVGLDVSSSESGDAVRFTVWDTGIGIAGAELPRLFQPFVQLDSSLARKHAGTGLGLTLVRKLAEMHGGGVAVESEPGKGSRFVVTLPQRILGPTSTRRTTPARGIRAVLVDDRAARERHASRTLHPSRILLAEDDEMNVATVIDFLRSRGHEVFVARDGQRAVSLAREIRPDLVLMDVQMPVMDGLAAMNAIRKDPEPAVRNVAIVALTALAMAGDRERCLAAGANEYVTKPVGLKRLAAIISELLGA